MADEIIQAIEFEAKGVKCALEVGKYGLEGAIKLARLLASFIKYGSGKMYKKWEGRSGLRSTKDMMKITDGRCKVIEVNEEVLEKIKDEISKKKLHYAFPVDLDPNDKMVPIMIPDDEADLFMSIVNAYQKQYNEELDANLSTYIQQKKELEEKKRKIEREENVDDVKVKEKIDDLDNQINNLNRAIEEGKALMNYTTDIKDVRSYLEKAEGTEFEHNPEFAALLQERGITYSVGDAKNIFVPIRNEKMIPEQKWSLYVPDIGAKIDRKFEVDEKTKLVYSTYSFKTSDGEIKSFCDKDYTFDSWNKEVLGKLLDEAGILEGTRVCVFNNNQDIAAYKKLAEKLQDKDLAKETLESISDNLKKNGASTESVNQMYGIYTELKKNKDSATVSKDTYSITSDIKNISQEKGRVKVDLGDNVVLSFSNIHEAKKNSDGTYTFNFNKESEPSRVSFVSGKTENVRISMDEAISYIKGATKNAVLNTVNIVSKK